MTPIAATSTSDGSVVIAVDMNVSDAEKELARLKKKIANTEKEIADATEKRDAAQQKSLFSGAELDAEKAKLQEIKDRLQEIRAMSSDKNLNPDQREAAKDLIPSVKEELADQQARVRMLQTEWNKLDDSVQRYDGKIKDATARLTAQTDEAGSLQRQISDAEKAVESLGVSDQRVVDLNSELLRLKERQKELESVGAGLGYEEYDQNAARIAEITQNLKDYKKALEDAAKAKSELGDTADGSNAPESSDAQSRLSTYLEKSSSIYKSINEMLGKTSEMSGAMQEMASLTSGELSGALSSAGAALGGFSTQMSSAIASAGPYIAIILAVVAALKKLSEMMMQFGQQATSGIMATVRTTLNAAAVGAQNLAAALKAIGGFGASAVKAIAGISQQVIALIGKLNPLPKMVDAIGSKVKRLGQMVRRVFVFSVITKGLRAIRSEISAFLNINTEFTTALRRLEGALLTAFQPIYEIVVPALTTLINVLTRAVATVTQFFASLFGTTAKQAQINAKDLYEQAHATTAAGDAAEEAAKQLAGFDEINKLDGDKKAGGGGATSVGTGPLFDYEYDETPFDEWGPAFSAFLDNLLEGIPKLRDLFKDFANWLNDLAKKLYDMFTFPGVLDKVKQLGKELAEALNDLVNWIDWEMLGRALGAGLNLALNFLTSFLYAFDWINLGRKLAEFVNGLVDEIDWYEFGRLLWAGFKIGLETLAGFIYGLNMPLMAEAASNTILGFFNEMKNTIDRIRWDIIGTKIAVFLNSIKWYDIITSAFSAISDGINALFMMASSFVRDLRWGDIASQIYNAINDSMGKIEWSTIGRTIGDALKSVFDFVKDIIKGIRWHEIGENIAEFILGFDWVGALGSLADLIAEGINAAVQLACGFLDKIMPEAFNIARGIAERLRNAVASVHWDQLGTVIGNGIKTALNFVAGLLDPNLFYEIGKAIGDFLINLDWPGILESLGNAIANGIKSAVALVRGFLDSVQPNLKELAADIAQKINEFVNKVDWAELGKTINEGINTALDFLLDILDQLDWDAIGNAIADFFINLNWGELMSKWGTVVGKAMGSAIKAIDLGDLLWLGANMVGGMIDGMLNKWEESGGILGWITRHLFSPFINAFKALFGIHSPSTVMAELGTYIIDGLLQGITQTWENITKFFSTAFESIKQTITGAWDSIKESTTAVWGSIESTLSTLWENLKQSASTVFSSVKETISTAWENIREKTSSAWDSIKSKLSQTWENLKTTASTTFSKIKEKVTEAWNNIKEKTSSVWNSIKSTLSQIWNNLKTTAESAFNTIKEKVKTAWETLKSDTSTKWNEIKSKLLDTWTELKTSASTKFQEIKQSIIDKMGELKNHDWMSIGKTIMNGIWDGLKNVWDSITRWIGDAASSIANAFTGASKSSRSGTFNAASSYGSSRSISMRSIPDISNFNIPALANGAVIPPNREFLAVLGDQNRGTNVEAPLSTIEQAVANVMSRMGVSNRSQTVVLEVEGRELGRAVVDFGGAEYQRIGVKLVEART